MKPYRNDYLDRVVAAMVLIIFFVALFFALVIIKQFWLFFRYLFCVVVVALSVWIVSMLYNIVWRYHAITQIRLDEANIPKQLSQKIQSEAVVNNRSEPAYCEPHNYPDGFFDGEEDY